MRPPHTHRYIQQYSFIPSHDDAAPRQVRQLFRAITADEYDAAVSACPGACLLYLMDDRHTGQQLRDDAAADARILLAAFFRALCADPASEAALLACLAKLPLPFQLRDQRAPWWATPAGANRPGGGKVFYTLRAGPSRSKGRTSSPPPLPGRTSARRRRSRRWGWGYATSRGRTSSGAAAGGVWTQ